MSRKKNTVSQKLPFLPKFRDEILVPAVSLKIGPFRPNFLAKLKGMVLNCGIRKWLVTKLNFRNFLLYLHSKNLDFAFLLKRQLRLKIDLSTKNRKLPQMTPRWYGNTSMVFFGVFNLFWAVLPPIYSEKRLFWPFWAISNDFDRFMAIYGGISPA